MMRVVFTLGNTRAAYSSASVQKLGSGAFSFCVGLTRLLFEGDAPRLYDPSLPAFEGTKNATVYYRTGTKGWGKTFGGLPTAVLDAQPPNWQSLLDATQKKYVAWDEKAHVSDYDPKQYEVGGKRDEFEAEWLKLLEGEEPGNPGHNRPHPYDQAIYGLATIKSAKAAPLLVKIAAERVVKDNAHRHYAVKALGILGDKAAIPALIPLLYHYNFNTRWNAQIALVQLTGQNFGRDAEAWGKWYNANRQHLGANLPAFDPTPVDWSCGSADQKLKSWCDPKVQIEADEKMLGRSSTTAQSPGRVHAAVTLTKPYPTADKGAATDKISVQYAVLELGKQVGLGYMWDESFKNTDPICREWVCPENQE